mmetsp:Transcript_66858/g.204746  ORF Transcript_66858/g.204746 Transcript_66858/m.204746 type:complete len:221 (+) Transcript_66858:1053-1715(+)
MEATKAYRTVASPTHDSVVVLALVFAETWVVHVACVEGYEAVLVASHAPVKVPINPTYPGRASGVLGRIVPFCPFPPRGAHGLEATEQDGRVPKADGLHARHHKVLSVLAQAHPEPGPRCPRIRIYVANQKQVRVERLCVQPSREVIVEMACAALNQPVIFVADVAGRIIKQARRTTESRKTLEGLQPAWGVGRLQMPAESTRMCRVVEKCQARLRSGNA